MRRKNTLWLAVAVAAVSGAFVANAEFAGHGPSRAPPAGGDAPTGAAAFVGAPPHAFADAAGDADDVGVDGMGYGPEGCRASGCHVPSYREGLSVTASDALDILELGLVGETPEALQLFLTLGRVDPSFAWLDDVPGLHRMAFYHVCFQAPGDAAERCAQLEVAVDGAQPILDGSFHVYDGGCNEVAECAWDVPFALEAGTPGSILFTVPKAFAFSNLSTPAAAAFWGKTEWYSTSTVAPAWHFAGSVELPSDHRHGHGGSFMPYNRADVTGRFEAAVAFGPGAATAPPPGPGPELVLQPGALYGGDSLLFDTPDLDLLSVDLREEGENLVADYEVSRLDASSTHDFWTITLLALPGGHVYEFGYYRATGTLYGYAGRCVSFACHDASYAEAPVEARAGSPGGFTVRIPLALFGTVPAGTTTNFLWVVSQYADYDLYYHPDEETRIDLHSMQLIDGHLGGQPFVFAAGADGPESGHHHGP